MLMTKHKNTEKYFTHFFKVQTFSYPKSRVVFNLNHPVYLLIFLRKPLNTYVGTFSPQKEVGGVGIVVLLRVQRVLHVIPVEAETDQSFDSFRIAHIRFRFHVRFQFITFIAGKIKFYTFFFSKNNFTNHLNTNYYLFFMANHYFSRQPQKKNN